MKARFMRDPKAVLKDDGLEVPDGMDAKVVEIADDCVHITLPAAPGGSPALSDDELSNAAGGAHPSGRDPVGPWSYLCPLDFTTVENDVHAHQPPRLPTV